jgi:hypothetical protein
MAKNLSRLMVIIVLVVALTGLGLQHPARADNSFPSTSTAIATWTAATLGIAAFSYFAWLNRPGNQPVDWSPRGPGGWYVGLYSGVSFVPTTDWHYKSPDPQAPTPYATTAQNIGFNASPVVGLKVGYYFHSMPNLGLEGDFFYSRPSVRDQTVTLSTPFPPNNRIPGNQALFPNQAIAQWTYALHIMGRLGFIKDDEVPFGRLQPYVGLGPGFTVLFGEVDAAKNFGVDGLVGLRYMLRKDISIFTEFKFNRQFAVELEHQKLKQLPSQGGFEQRALASFDYTMLTWAVGLTVHFW